MGGRRTAARCWVSTALILFLSSWVIKTCHGEGATGGGGGGERAGGGGAGGGVFQQHAQQQPPSSSRQEVVQAGAPTSWSGPGGTGGRKTQWIRHQGGRVGGRARHTLDGAEAESAEWGISSRKNHWVRSDRTLLAVETSARGKSGVNGGRLEGYRHHNPGHGRHNVSVLGAEGVYDDYAVHGGEPTASTDVTEAGVFYGGYGGDDDDDGGSAHRGDPSVHQYVSGIVIPAIGVLGVLGNVLNLAILSWRCAKRDDDTLEKVALIGLIALAVSDLCFCFTIIPYAFAPKGEVYVEGTRPSFAMVFHVYGTYAQNVFIKTSTWLTMIVATARYIAICHPLKARFCFGIRPTRIAIVSTYVFWVVFLLPESWALVIVRESEDNQTFYYVDTGPFSDRPWVLETFTFLWAFVGYFVPVAILGFCNVRLIQALRESRRLRKSVAHCASSRHGGGLSASGNSSGPVDRHSANQRKTSNRITMTLIALVLMFLVLVCPSELLHFVKDVSGGEIATAESLAFFEVATVVCNLLQAFNFALHFVLYVVVNVTFRRTLVNLALGLVRWVRYRGFGGARHHRRYDPRAGASSGGGVSAHTSFASLSRRPTLTPSNAKSCNETNI